MIALPSIQSLLIEMRFNGQLLSTATGFVSISRTGGAFLLTNRHNVTGRNQETGKPLSATGGLPNEIGVLQNSQTGVGQWIPKLQPLFDNNGNPLWKEHPTLGPRADFVAIPLQDLSGVQLHPYDTQNPGAPISLGPSETISVIGFPFGMTAGGAFAVWATGFLASEPDVDFQGLPIQLIDCRSRQGQSGSPVVAYRAGGAYSTTNGGTVMNSVPVLRFIGIYSGRINSESDLGIVWKVSALEELVSTL
jgi:hypothetical protein